MYSPTSIFFLFTLPEERSAIENGGQVLLDLMRKCWQQNPKHRPNFGQVFRALHQIGNVRATYELDRNKSVQSRDGSTYRAPSPLSSEGEQQKRAMERSLLMEVSAGEAHGERGGGRSKTYSSLSVTSQGTDSRDSVGALEEFTRVI